MRFPSVLLPFLAAVMLAGTLIATDEAQPQTTPFHRTGRAFFPDQGSSLVVTKGWHKQTSGNSTILYARSSSGQQANVIISVWEAKDPLEKFVSDTSAKLATTGYKPFKPEPFITFSKIEGIRLRA